MKNLLSAIIAAAKSVFGKNKYIEPVVEELTFTEVIPAYLGFDEEIIVSVVPVHTTRMAAIEQGERNLARARTHVMMYRVEEVLEQETGYRYKG